MARKQPGPAANPETTSTQATEPVAKPEKAAGPKALPFDPKKLETCAERTNQFNQKLKVWDVVPGDPEECRKRDEWLATVGKAHFRQSDPSLQAHYPDARAQKPAATPEWDGPLDGACYVGYPFAAWYQGLEKLGEVGLLRVGFAKDCSCAVYVRTDQWSG